MKKRILMLMAVVLLIASNLFAADGDLIVDGNVGIGTNNPAAKLDVVGTTGTNSMARFTGTNNRRMATFINTLTDDTQPFGYALDIGTTQSGGIAGINGMSAVIALTHNSTISGVTGGSAASYTFQIGSATGSGTVDIDSVSGFTYTLNRRFNISSGLTYNVAKSYGALFKIQDGGASDYSGVVNVTNHYGSYIADYANSGTRRVNIANLTGLYIEKLIGGGVSNAGIVLAGDGAGADLVLGASKETKLYGNAGDLIIDTTGNVGIGTTNPAYDLDVAGTVNASGGYEQISDVKFKEDIALIDSPLKTILQMKGISYSWRTEEFRDMGFSDGRHYGVVAQEVEQVLPEIVNTNSLGIKSVSYDEIIPVLIEAVKEQQKIIEELKRKVQELETRDYMAGAQ